MKFSLWISHGLSVQGRYPRVYMCCSQILAAPEFRCRSQGHPEQTATATQEWRTSPTLGQRLPHLFVRNRLGLCPVVMVAGDQEVTVTLLAYKGLGKRGGLTLSHKSVVNLLTPHCFFWANMFKSRCKTEF